MSAAKRPDRVVLGVTGSIAAYKAAELVRLLVKGGMDVSVIMTKAATEFVGELTFRTLSRNPVAVDCFDKSFRWEPEHISLADRADVMAIAPCTANVLAKLACGMADDLLTCAALACRAPMVVAPAMNERMWLHPATRRNLDVLKSRGVEVVEGSEGELACGGRGAGRMAEPAEIVRAIERLLGRKDRRMRP